MPLEGQFVVLATVNVPLAGFCAPFTVADSDGAYVVLSFPPEPLIRRPHVFPGTACAAIENDPEPDV